MKKTLLVTTMLVLASSIYAYARPGDPFTQYGCGRNTVSQGDPADKVRAYCGEPSSIQNRESTRGKAYAVSKDYYRVKTNTDNIEEWTYNFGPRGGMVQMNFRNGTLMSIIDRGAGY